MSGTLSDLSRDALSALAQVTDEAGLAGWHREMLGRKGSLTEALKGLAELDADARRARGRELNALKQELEVAFESRQAAIQSELLDSRLLAESIDVSLPGR